VVYLSTVITSDYALRIQTTWNHLFINHTLKQCPNLVYYILFKEYTMLNEIIT
jgi:hypothetical protein